MSTPATDRELDLELTAALRGRGHRVTVPRLLVHRHVRRSRGHLTAEQVHGELAPGLPSLSPATIYATLDLLDELGFVRRLSTPGGTIVYDPRTEAHHHAICRRCGRMVPFEDSSLERAIAELSDAISFEVTDHDVVLRGTCERCAG